MYVMAESRGLAVEWMTKGQGFGVMTRLGRGERPADVAQAVHLRQWQVVGPSDAQVRFMRNLGLPWERAKCKHHARLLLDAHLEPLKLYKRLVRQVDKATTPTDLDAVGRDIALVRDVLPAQHFDCLVELGKERRAVVGESGDIPE